MRHYLVSAGGYLGKMVLGFLWSRIFLLGICWAFGVVLFSLMFWLCENQVCVVGCCDFFGAGAWVLPYFVKLSV